MRAESHENSTWRSAGKQMVLAFLALALLVGIGVTFFLKIYSRYDSEVLYAERLNQMQEVTEQLFSGLEDIVDVQWQNAQYQCGYLKMHTPTTVGGLLRIMAEQSSLWQLSERQTDLIAIDADGRYYYSDGKRGLLYDMSYLEGRPEQISYVLNDMTDARTQMLFLYRLDEPVALRDGERVCQIIYYGIVENMEQLNPYFDCKAYNGSNSTYVVDEQGLKLFSGSGGDLLKGFNVFSVLRNMEYLHDSSFDDTLQTMQETGLAYSNALLDGEEYYYSLYRMENSQWIVLFLVPSAFVATNTVQLVNTTTNLLMTFAVLMALACAGLIYILLRIQQKKALDFERQNSERLARALQKAELAEQAAKQANRAKSEFLSNMSHDIRTPMNAIVGITNLMEHEKDDPEKLEAYIQKVQLSSRHLLSLINDVLDMSKIESGNVTLNREPVNLAEQVGQVNNIIRPQTEERRQTYQVSVHGIVHECLVGDAVRLRQVMINLLSNAVKYTPNGGSISFDISEHPSKDPDQAQICITVSDNGYGMTQEFMSHIFEPFTRAENSTVNKVQGTGLGMAITKNIVDLMGGTITVRSKVNKGTRFQVTLPLPIDQEAAWEVDASRVLLIAQEDTVIRNVEKSLSQAGLALYVADTAPKGVSILQQQDVDTVLLTGHLQDPHLPELVHLLRKEAKEPILIFCMDYTQREDLSVVLQKIGLDGLIPRPFFLTNFAQAVNQARGSTEQNPVQAGSVLSGLRFLCAEDNALNAEILNAILDMNHASCVIYPNGQKLVEAFATVKEGEYDAILMDVQMPVMNGLDATRAIRHGANPLGQTIPIIAMTANAFSEDVQNCLNAGMNAHVSKPLDISALEQTLKCVLNGKFLGGGHLFAARRHIKN